MILHVTCNAFKAGTHINWSTYDVEKYKLCNATYNVQWVRTSKNRKGWNVEDEPETSLTTFFNCERAASKFINHRTTFEWRKRQSGQIQILDKIVEDSATSNALSTHFTITPFFFRKSSHGFLNSLSCRVMSINRGNLPQLSFKLATHAIVDLSNHLSSQRHRKFLFLLRKC